MCSNCSEKSSLTRMGYVDPVLVCKDCAIVCRSEEDFFQHHLKTLINGGQALVCAHVHVCLCAALCVCVCMVCVRACMHACVCVCAHIHVVYVHVWMYLLLYGALIHILIPFLPLKLAYDNINHNVRGENI